jgi:hypothetical protein
VLGVPRRTFFRRVKEAIERAPHLVRGENEGRLVHLELLGPEALERWQALQRANDRVDGSAVVERLARFGDPELERAYLAEAERRAGILDSYSAIEPKMNCRGEPTRLVRDLLASWPATDPRVVADRPSWAKPISFRTLRLFHSRWKTRGIDALLPAQWAVQRGVEYTDDVAAVVRRLRLIDFPHLNTSQLYRRAVKLLGADAIGSLSTFKRRLKELCPADLQVLARQGLKTYRSKIAPYVPRDWATGIDVGEILIADHHQLDILAINADRKGALDRPWLTTFLDGRTRAPMGSFIGWYPNAEAVKRAFLDAIEPKAEPQFAHLYGIPKALYADNGKDFRAEHLEGLKGIFTELGIHVIHAIPFNAKAKIVERFHSTICEGWAKAQQSYWGSSAETRPERTRELAARYELALKEGRRDPSLPFMTLDEVRASYRAWLLEYLETPSAALTDAATGRVFTPAAIAAERREPPRVLPRSLYDAVALRATEATVDRGSVKLRHHELRTTLMYSAEELFGHHAEKVWVRWDPRDLNSVLITSMKPGVGVICRAELVTRSVQRADGTVDAPGVKRLAFARKRERELLEMQRRLARFQQEFDPHEAAKILLGPEPPQPAPPTAPLPAGGEAVTAMLPGPAALAREIRRRPPKRAVEHPSTVRPLDAPAVDADVEYVAELLGPRPELSPEAAIDPEMRAYDLQRQADWDAEAARVLANRKAQGRSAAK